MWFFGHLLPKRRGKFIRGLTRGMPSQLEKKEGPVSFIKDFF